MNLISGMLRKRYLELKNKVRATSINSGNKEDIKQINTFFNHVITKANLIYRANNGGGMPKPE